MLLRPSLTRSLYPARRK